MGSPSALSPVNKVDVQRYLTPKVQAPELCWLPYEAGHCSGADADRQYQAPAASDAARGSDLSVGPANNWHH